jgi:tetratricopeptide (TPR) repeat protein
MTLAWWGNGCLKTVEAYVIAGFDMLLLAVLVTDPSLLIKLTATLLIFAPYIYIHVIFNPGSLKKYYEEEAAKMRHAVDLDPKNWGNREFLAQALYKSGDLDGAIAEQRLAVEMNPNADKEKYILKEWEAEKQEKDTGFTVCPHCGTSNPKSRNWCKGCEARIIRYQEKPWLSELGYTGFIVAFGAVTLTIVSFAVLPGGYGLIPTVCLLIAAAGWKLMSSNK